MQIFACPTCGHRLWFQNATCPCGQSVRFDPETQSMQASADSCVNFDAIGCNWQPGENGYCASCNLTETVPDLRKDSNLPLWERTEAAKRWMLANLARWGWFTLADTGARPTFKMLAEQTVEGREEVVMGHASGEITINVSEADPAIRAQRRAKLGELYRTMLGHMRHEMAHFLFERLLRRPGFADDFRALFGDERADYAQALKQHYTRPAPADEWHITSYATAHPHEDWAETVAHLLHLVDLLDSATAAGLVGGYDPYGETDTDGMLTRAIDLSLAANHVNRALDLADVYPFILPPGVRGKMAFAHRHLRQPAP
ncbi:zinc-binding metallopeptidase family protein [Primorskyibacter sp. 2E107]|uniref:zinc-binding metallopeptidase family protein n=1 Tax=Primorskyibacter sp. 2E107 TaxID=3403458 RepID=UPI003AF5FB91